MVVNKTKVPRRSARASRHRLGELPIDMPRFKCFGCSTENQFGLQLDFVRSGPLVVSTYTPPTHFQGWAGMVHGGILSTLFDELGVWTLAGLRHRVGLTRDVEVHFRRPMYVGEEIQISGKIEDEKGPIVTVRGELHNPRQDLCVEGTVKVFMLSREQFAKMQPDGRIPEAFRGFF